MLLWIEAATKPDEACAAQVWYLLRLFPVPVKSLLPSETSLFIWWLTRYPTKKSSHQFCINGKVGKRVGQESSYELERFTETADFCKQIKETVGSSLNNSQILAHSDIDGGQLILLWPYVVHNTWQSLTKLYIIIILNPLTRQQVVTLVNDLMLPYTCRHVTCSLLIYPNLLYPRAFR